MNTLDHQLTSALSDIVVGKNVKRSKHELVYEQTDVTESFITVMRQHHFHPTTVDAVAVAPGERVPAFFIEGTTAYFGWIFWEKFSQLRLRKLFGTVVRNAKGDWYIQLPSNSSKTLYADTSQIFDMDIDRPFEL